MTAVILVHGLYRTSADWAAMKVALTAQGYQPFAPDLPGQDNYANAQFLHDYINQVAPGQQVVIVAHSRGGLCSRWYLKHLGGTALVTRLVTIGTPHQGEWYQCLAAPPVNQSCPNSQFIYWLNYGLETPGPTLYTSLWGNYDDGASARLTGAFCNSGSLGNVQHLAEPSDAGVIAKVEAALAGVCP